MLDAGIAHTVTVVDDLLRAHFARSDIDHTNRSPFDLVEGAADFVAVTAQHHEFSANGIGSLEGVEITSIRVLGHQSQGSFLAGTSHENWRMRFGKRRRNAERLGELVVSVAVRGGL